MTGIAETIESTQTIENEFFQILEKQSIKTLYQPIINMANGSILGYEALSRGPENSALESPHNLISVAESLGKAWDLEQLLRTKALERAQCISDHLLFINIDPNIFHDDNFQKGFTLEFLEEMKLSPSSIVFELTERTAIKDYRIFNQVLEHYTKQGYSIAIDDAGSGYSGLKTLYEVSPNYIKIDMDFVRNIDTDTFKQSIVKNLLETAKSANIKSIAEGIETAEELRTLIRLGVEYGQGYFIQKPSEHIKAISDHVLSILSREMALINQINNYSQDYHYIHHLMASVDAFSPDDKCITIFDYLNAHKHAATCICQGNFPIGIITLREINAAFAKQYGHSVYSQRPVSLIMNKSPLMVDYYMPIQMVAKKALARSQEFLYDDIIVCKGSTYVGMVTMKKLLEYAINYEKNYAKELNPLTALPGNVIINRVMKAAVETERETFIIYADLDNFKVYNDIYGFDKGDKVIKFTADILEDISTKHFPYTTFLGHIGGDDFIIVANANKEQLDLFCRDIIETFDTKIQAFFTEEDLKKGYITAVDRTGQEKQFALTGITLAGVIGNLKYFSSVEELSANLAKLKKEGKKNPSSSFLLHTLTNCQLIQNILSS